VAVGDGNRLLGCRRLAATAQVENDEVVPGPVHLDEILGRHGRLIWAAPRPSPCGPAVAGAPKNKVTGGGEAGRSRKGSHQDTKEIDGAAKGRRKARHDEDLPSRAAWRATPFPSPRLSASCSLSLISRAAARLRTGAWRSAG